MLCIRSRRYSGRLPEAECRCTWPLMRFDSSRPGLCYARRQATESYFSPQGRDFTHKSGDEEPRHASCAHIDLFEFTLLLLPRPLRNNVPIKFSVPLELEDVNATHSSILHYFPVTLYTLTLLCKTRIDLSSEIYEINFRRFVFYAVFYAKMHIHRNFIILSKVKRTNTIAINLSTSFILLRYFSLNTRFFIVFSLSNVSLLTRGGTIRKAAV